MKNYQCKNCKVLVQGNSTPTTLGCPSGKGHSWTNLGDVGEKNYQCKNCGTLVHTNSSPTTLGCPSGKGHSWTKL
jgi:DNA-directed RNA polymerase subunit RPC12/RpoP